MKTLLRIFFALSLVAILGTGAQSQGYDSALGLRLGSPNSVSYKTFVSNKTAVEVFVGYRSFRSDYSWINIGAAYQIHNGLDEVLDGLSWYYGIGASVYLFSYRDAFQGDRDASTSLGIQGYLGLDYSFKDAPVNLSLDWVPTIFLNGFGNGFSADYGALSVRYILGQ